MSAKPAPREVFLSYAPEDESLCLELEKHLSLLKRENLITTWHKGQIGAGKDYEKEMTEHLSTASIIVLLLSTNFVASDACYGIEMRLAVERHKAGEAYVVPVVLRPMESWSTTPFGSLAALPGNGIPVTMWSDAHAAFADIAKGIRSVLQDGKLPPTAPVPLPLPSIWNIPYPRNPFFTGRDELLRSLATALKARQATALSQPQTIGGLGGIGKTQMAVEYCYQHARDYEVILWAHAQSAESLNASYTEIARLLSLAEKETQEQERVVQSVKNWLQTQGSWLLVLDNADEPELLRPFLPPFLRGHLLVTTRASDLTHLGMGFTHALSVESFTPQDGATFLLRRAGRASTLGEVTLSDHTRALSICEALGGLPLALDQAGAYVKATGSSLESYERIYQQHRLRLLKDRRGHEHPEPVATTWALSFGRAEQQCKASGDLLRLCAFLAADVIPEEVITQGAAYLGERLQPIASDPFLLDEAIGALSAYSLIRRNPSNQTLSIHRLVQAVLKDTMDEETKKQWAERAVLAVNAVFPVVEFATWPQCERCLPHALLCAELIEQGQPRSLEAARLLNKTGSYLHDRARYLEAEPLYKRALSIGEQLLGGTHAEVATILNNLALLYYHQDKFDQAEPLHERALAIREQQLGPMHPDTATSLNNLALLYKHQGKFEQAEPLYQRALAIREQQPGPMHPDTATILNNLAGLYRVQGKFEQAEPLLERALAIYEKAYGPSHPDVARDLHNLALLYNAQGKYNVAEPLFRRALLIRKQTLGETHPDTQNTRQWYISLLRKTGRDNEATALEAAGQLPSEEP